MRHPSEYFLKFLMTQQRPEALEDKWIAATLESFGYPPAWADYLKWLRGSFAHKMPADFRPTDRYHRPSVTFLKDEGIYSLHNPDGPSREATLLMADLRTRGLVESLLLGHVDTKEIAKKVNARLKTFYTSEGITAYRHYYWNVSLLRMEEWAILLDKYEEQKTKAMAILQVGPSMAFHIAGFQQTIESKVMLREMQEGLYFDFKQWQKQRPSLDRTRAMTNIAKATAMIDNQLAQSDAAIKDSLRAFEQFRMQHAKSTVDDMRAIAPEGNFTGSGAHLLEAIREEATAEEAK